MMTETATRIPPQNREFELTIIGAVLLDKVEALPALMKYAYIVSPDISEVFYCSDTKAIIKAIISLQQQNIVPDILSILPEYERLNLISDGGFISNYQLSEYISMVSCTAYSAIEYYIQKLIELYIKRLVIKETTQIIDDAYTKQSTQLSVIEQIRTLLNQTQNLIPSNIKIITPENIVEERINGLIKRRTNKRQLTGFPSWDNYISEGFGQGLLTLLAGPPSSGKTAVAVNLIEKQCEEQGLKIYAAVPEMLSPGLLDRVQAIRTGIPITDLKKIRDWNDDDPRGEILDQDIKHISKNWKLYIDGNRGIDIPTYLNRIEDVMNKIGGLDIIYFDTMNTIPDIAACRSDKEKMGGIINQLEIFADKKQVHIVMLSHFNNYIFHRKDRTPNISDLDFGAIYNEKSHNIFFTMRNYVFDKEAEDNEMTIWVAKQRDGPTGKVELEWIKETGKIVDPLHSDRRKPDKKKLIFDLNNLGEE